MDNNFRKWCDEVVPKNLVCSDDKQLHKLMDEAYHMHKLISGSSDINGTFTDYALNADGIARWIALEIVRSLSDVYCETKDIDMVVSDNLIKIFQKAINKKIAYKPILYPAEHNMTATLTYDGNNKLSVEIAYEPAVSRLILRNISAKWNDFRVGIIEQVIGSKLVNILDHGLAQYAGDLYDLWCAAQYSLFDMYDVYRFICGLGKSYKLNFTNLPITSDDIGEVHKCYENIKIPENRRKPSFDDVMQIFTAIVNELRDKANIYTWNSRTDVFDKWLCKLSTNPICNTDKIVGEVTDPFVLAGEYALQRCGLVNLHQNYPMQGYTLRDDITGVITPWVHWYFNHNAKDYSHTIKSVQNENILIPSQERAMVECMLFSEWFDEDVIFEAIKAYLRSHVDISKLISVAEEYHLCMDCLNEWLHGSDKHK